MIVVNLDTQDSILLKSNDTSFRVLYYILLQRDPRNNIWYADFENKELICNELNISMPAMAKILASLHEREILIRLSKGKYQLPDYFLDC